MNNQNQFNGDNLRLARLVLGVSLDELGERVGVSRQYIHQLETSDKKVPTRDLLHAFAHELHVKANYFSVPLGIQVQEEECHFRKAKTTLVSARRECRARATLLNKLVSELDRRLKLPSVNFPKTDVKSFYDVEKAALEAREYWKLGSGPISNVVRVLENAGAIIATFGEVSEKVDAMSVDRDRPIILFNPVKSSPRIRMDLAHECGHIIMHQGIETGDIETESQANYFASVFLLPRVALLKEYGAQAKSRIDWHSIYRIKTRWKISARAIIYRLHQLEILTPTQYRSANIRLSKTGQTKGEHYDNEIPMESPELLSKSISLLGQKFGVNLGGIMERLGITLRFLSSLTQLQSTIDSISRECSYGENVLPLDKYRHSN